MRGLCQELPGAGHYSFSRSRVRRGHPVDLGKPDCWPENIFRLLLIVHPFQLDIR
jgi:hypothetical protein